MSILRVTRRDRKNVYNTPNEVIGMVKRIDARLTSSN